MAGAFPVLAQQLGEDVVEPAAVPEVLPAQPADLPVAGPQLGPPAGLVALQVAGLQLAERVLRERVVRAQAHQLPGDAPAPDRLVADERAGGAVLIDPVDGAD